MNSKAHHKTLNKRLKILVYFVKIIFWFCFYTRFVVKIKRTNYIWIQLVKISSSKDDNDSDIDHEIPSEDDENIEGFLIPLEDHPNYDKNIHFREDNFSIFGFTCNFNLCNEYPSKIIYQKFWISINKNREFRSLLHRKKFKINWMN